MQDRTYSLFRILVEAGRWQAPSTICGMSSGHERKGEKQSWEEGEGMLGQGAGGRGFKCKIKYQFGFSEEVTFEGGNGALLGMDSR